MRTTVTLDPDVAALVRRAMKDNGISFKEAINNAIRAGMVGTGEGLGVDLPVFDMGEPLVDLTKAIHLADEPLGTQPEAG